MKFKSIFVSAMALAMMTSCSQEEAVNSNPQIGEATYASFSFSVVDGTVSRAGDINAPLPGTDPSQNVANAAESKVSKFSVYIFDKPTQVLEQVLTLQPNTVSTRSLAEKVNVGEKMIYVMINGALPSTDYQIKSDTQAGTTVSEFKAIQYAADKSKINSSEGLLMIGWNEDVFFAKQNQTAALANPVQVSVTRAAAKVQVNFKADAINGANVAKVVNGKFLGAQFLICNRNKTMYIRRDGWLGTPGAASSTASGNIYSHINGLDVTSGIKCDTEDMILAPATLTETEGTWQYVSENVNQTNGTVNPFVAPTQIVSNAFSGNTTYALVEAEFIPAKFRGTEENSYTPNSATTAADFWAICKNTADGTTSFLLNRNTREIEYFADQATADAVFAANSTYLGEGWAVAKYTGGKCYYRLNIKTPGFNDHAQSYSIIRGRAYQVNVSKVSLLGANAPALVSPTVNNGQLEVDAYMAAEISIAPWKFITSDYTLGD